MMNTFKGKCFWVGDNAGLVESEIRTQLETLANVISVNVTNTIPTNMGFGCDTEFELTFQITSDNSQEYLEEELNQFLDGFDSLEKVTKPFFISIEGGEGSGKSTVIKSIQEYLFRTGIPTVITREPGGDKVCESIRSTILDNEMHTWTEALLFLAARKEHCENVISPALQNSQIVICDRYYDSSIVYQGIVGNLDKDVLMRMHEEVGVEIPDLTIVLDVDPKIGLQRISSNSHREVNRIDLKGLAFHQKVRQGFLTLASLEENEDRIIVVDASGNTENTLELIIRIIEERLEEQ